MDGVQGLVFLTLVFGGVPALIACATIFVGVIGAVLTFPWRNSIALRRTAWAAALAAPPLAAVLWVERFAVLMSRRYPYGAPAWFTGFLGADLAAGCALAVWLVVTKKGIRLFAFLLGAASVAFTFLVALDGLLMTVGEL